MSSYRKKRLFFRIVSFAAINRSSRTRRSNSLQSSAAVAKEELEIRSVFSILSIKSASADTFSALAMDTNVSMLIQLLVNPEAKLVAIQPVEKGTPGKQGHRIVASRMQSERSYELYSRLFVQRLRVLAPELEDGCAYRLHGSVISSKRVAVFPLETLQRVDKQEFVSL